MNILALDFETYFDDDYTLKKLTTEAYIRDPRFEVHGCGFRRSDGRKEWVPLHDALDPQHCVRTALMDFGAERNAVLCHHAHFDGLILSHHFGVRPKFWLDTLSMARQVHGNHVSASLDSLSKHYGLPNKVLNYAGFKGKHWSDMDEHTRHNVAEGCLDDVDKLWFIFNELAKTFPASEYPIVDTTIRMFTEPVLIGDPEKLGQLWYDEDRRKKEAMARVGATKAQLNSNDQFAELLLAAGIEPALKKGKDDKNGEPRMIYAFAKTDEFMEELLEHPDEYVQALAMARLGLKSTLLQTRAERMGDMAMRGPQCVYLGYGNAHTMRWGGGDKMNWQNLPRHRKDRRSLLRDATMAPEGHLLAVVDASQIECRMLNMVAGQDDLIEKFRNKEDPYLGMASVAYGREIVKADVAERGTGKQLELSCGYGAGAKTIVHTARLGIYGPPVIIDLGTGYRWRNAYRGTHPFVVAYWKEAEDNLFRMNNFQSFDWGVLRVECNAENGTRRIFGPNGSWLNYDTLEWWKDEKSGEEGWRTLTRNGYRRMYGAKLVENIIQFLARIHVSDVMHKIRAAGLRTLLCTHDETVTLVKDDQFAESTLNWLIEQMRTPPKWLPNIPLDAEGGLAVRYGEAK